MAIPKLPPEFVGRGSIYQQRARSQNYIIKYRVHGKWRAMTTGTANWDEACAILAQHLGAAANGLPLPAPGEVYTFDDAARLIEDNYFVKGRRSLQDLKRRIRKHLRPAFGDLERFEDITEDHIIVFQKQQLEKGYAHAEINRQLAALKRMFKLAYRSKRIRSFPYIEMLDESHNVRRGFFETDEYAAVHRALATSDIGAALQGPTTFCYVTGWRMVSEVLTLEWHQIDRTACTVRLHTSKNDDGRVYPYRDHPLLVKLFANQWRLRQGFASNGKIVPHVFQVNGDPLYRIDKHGTPYMVRSARIAWRAACKAVGLPGRIPHDFRRTAVRALMRSGVPEKRSMTLTGHKTRSVFDRYDIVNEADLAKDVAQLATYHVRSKVIGKP